MGFNVKYDDITNTWLQSVSKINEWNEQLSSVSESLRGFIDMESFKGVTATNIKSYIYEVHFTILTTLGEVMTEYQSRLLLYRDGYYDEIDGNNHSVLNEETLNNLISFFPMSEINFSQQHTALTSASNQISDLMGVGIPSNFHIIDSYGTVYKRIKELRENTGNYESTHRNQDLENFKSLIATAKAFIESYYSQSIGNILNYQAGSVAEQQCFLDLENAIVTSYETRASLADELAAASENETVRMEILEDEWAKAREEEGLWQWIAGAGAVIVGTICIVATAGAATPLVVAGFVAGGSSILYGCSEMIEGEQEMYYGSIGDPYTLSYNPIRDTIFAGNQEAYDTWGTISTTVAGILIPVGQGYTAAANAAKSVGTTATRSMIARSIAYEVGKDTISAAAGMGATYVGTNVGTELFGADAGKWIGIGAGLLAGYGTSSAIDRLNSVKNFSGLVSGTSGGNGSSGTKTLTSSEAEEHAFSAIKGADKADSAMLGKYQEGSPSSYDALAKEYGSQYFNLDNWDELSKVYSADEIWKINEKFLDIQTSSGRDILLSHNPADYIGDTSFYAKEIQYLIDNKYVFKLEGDVWRAIR